jgi:hypothetical protein
MHGEDDGEVGPQAAGCRPVHGEGAQPGERGPVRTDEQCLVEVEQPLIQMLDGKPDEEARRRHAFRGACHPVMAQEPVSSVGVGLEEIGDLVAAVERSLAVADG